MACQAGEITISDLPFTFDDATGKVTVRDIDYFPQEIFELGDKVEILDMSTVQIATLPADLHRLKNVRVAFFSYNKAMTIFPDVFAPFAKLKMIGIRGCNITHVPEDCLPASLKALILTDNKITALPRSIGNCTNLQKLMLSGNRLASLPRELLQCQKLEGLRISVNQLQEAPDWLFDLPRLAWYADSSNPYSLQLKAGEIHEIDCQAITMGDEIGRSVNNVIYRAELNRQAVAVKVFGGDIVTDGYASDDMNACLRVGNHPNIIGGIGKVINAPDGQNMLVMPLISDEFTTLGKPPTFASITRDTYPEDQTFTLDFVKKVLTTVAEGMRHLHKSGVMHGDLYAHNVMSNSDGQSYVGDFGGASIYQPGSEAGRRRERIDVMAFGILTEELLQRTTHDQNLAKLMADCMNPVTRQRPSFVEILDRLATLD